MQKLIVGLGNPGEEYEKTRHNVGFIILDALASSMRSEKWEMSKKFNSLLTSRNSQLILSKPQTLMNDSGKAVAKLANYYKVKISDIWIIHDDLDIKLGQYKIQQGVGPKVHNEVNSIEKELGTEDFWRVRVGIDNRQDLRFKNQDSRISGEEYVLQKFTNEEIVSLKGVLEEVTGDLMARLDISV